MTPTHNSKKNLLSLFGTWGAFVVLKSPNNERTRKRALRDNAKIFFGESQKIVSYGDASKKEGQKTELYFIVYKDWPKDLSKFKIKLKSIVVRFCI